MRFSGGWGVVVLTVMAMRLSVIASVKTILKILQVDDYY